MGFDTKKNRQAVAVGIAGALKGKRTLIGGTPLLSAADAVRLGQQVIDERGLGEQVRVSLGGEYACFDPVTDG